MSLRPYQNAKFLVEMMAQFLLVAVLFTMYLHLAIVLPMEQAPDEAMRYDLAKWIYEHMALPIGNEAEIVSPVWGVSYAYNPYLPSMLAALLMRVASIFDASEQTLLVAARMVSVLASCEAYAFASESAHTCSSDGVAHTCWRRLSAFGHRSYS